MTDQELNYLIYPSKVIKNTDTGEKMYVDLAGDPIHKFDNTTGEKIKFYIFVTCIGCSSYP